MRPAIASTVGGGSVQQPLQYMDTTIPTPSAPSGANLLVQRDLIVRPTILRQDGGSKGGFLPSVMKGVVNSGIYVAPLAALAAKRMWYDNTTRKKGGGKKENWSRNREAAKEELAKYGKPSGLNINKYAALKRKNEDAAEDWLTEYILKKRKTAKKGAKKTGQNKTEKKPKETKPKETKPKKAINVSQIQTAELWKDLVARARENLKKYGKPSGPNIMKFASMKRKAVNTTAFLANYKTRKHYASPPKTTTAPVKTPKPTSKSPPPVKPPPINWKTAYAQAKTNLTTIRAKPKASQIASLAALRRRGQSNAAFLQTYKTEN